MHILLTLMRMKDINNSIEYMDNRLSLYSAQNGKCAVTGRVLELGEIHCHHKTLRKQGGTDKYNNLVLVSDKIHILIHATDEKIISAYTEMLHLDAKQKAKLNKLRRSANLFTI